MSSKQYFTPDEKQGLEKQWAGGMRNSVHPGIEVFLAKFPNVGKKRVIVSLLIMHYRQLSG